MVYSDIFCKVYNEFGWNYYPECFGQQLLVWLEKQNLHPGNCMDLACGTGVLCRILQDQGIQAVGMDFSPGMIRIASEENPDISFEVADMITFCPESQYDLVTCTGDALNHIKDLNDVHKIFQNVFRYTSEEGYFIFDVLNENEVSTSEPFEMDYDETTRVWFQMTRPGSLDVNLKIRVYQNSAFQFEENIRERIHDPEVICDLLQSVGFEVVRCADSLLEDGGHGTTWFVIARKPCQCESLEEDTYVI